jgi:hypothetical protein
VATIPFVFEQKVAFTHAGKTWRVRTGFGWLQIRLPDSPQVLWLLVAHSFGDGHDLILLTNVPLRTPAQVRQVYQDWRRQFKIRTTAISGDFCVSCPASSRQARSGNGLWRRLADRRNRF